VPGQEGVAVRERSRPAEALPQLRPYPVAFATVTPTAALVTSPSAARHRDRCAPPFAAAPPGSLTRSLPRSPTPTTSSPAVNPGSAHTLVSALRADNHGEWWVAVVGIGTKARRACPGAGGCPAARPRPDTFTGRALGDAPIAPREIVQPGVSPCAQRPFLDRTPPHGRDRYRERPSTAPRRCPFVTRATRVLGHVSRGAHSSARKSWSLGMAFWRVLDVPELSFWSTRRRCLRRAREAFLRDARPGRGGADGPTEERVARTRQSWEVLPSSTPVVAELPGKVQSWPPVDVNNPTRRVRAGRESRRNTYRCGWCG
jgi:hypothetical protein